MVALQLSLHGLSSYKLRYVIANSSFAESAIARATQVWLSFAAFEAAPLPLLLEDGSEADPCVSV